MSSRRSLFPADSPLLGLRNVVLTPHTAGISEASVRRVKTEVGQAAAAVLSGRWPKSVVNPNVRPRVALMREDKHEGAHRLHWAGHHGPADGAEPAWPPATR